MWMTRVPPLRRKLKYVKKFASIDGILATYYQFRDLLDLIQLQIGWDTLFRSLLDLHLQLNLHFDPSEFEVFKLKLSQLFPFSLETIEKARYGISRYDYSIYDPEQVSPKNLERYTWELTYKTTHHKERKIRHVGRQLVDYLQIHKDMLAQLGINKDYVQGMHDTIALVEGKILNKAYWGFAVWDGAVWSEEDTYDQRSPEDWSTQLRMETINVYESHWDYSRWDYARWVDDDLEMDESIEEYIDKLIEEKHKWVEPVWEGTFLLQRIDRLHTTGGYYQLKSQNVNDLVKRICYKHGVPVTQIYAYIAFANELLYMKYTGYRKAKQWRQMVTADDIMNKYVKMGLDRQVLDEIRKALGL